MPLTLVAAANYQKLPRRAILRMVLVLPFLTFALTSCTAMLGHTYRFRLTVEVETPDGLRSGSSVYEVMASNDFPGSTRRFWRVRGEAAAVDLPGGRTLFALLKTNAHFEDLVGLSMQTLNPQFTERNDVVGTAKRFAAHQGATSPALVDPSIYPMLVTFRDIDDPATVQLVDSDDLAASFGEGYALKRITVQITDDPVTAGIEKRLGWLSQQRKYGLAAEDHPGIPLGNFRGLFSSEYF